jgi:hypothetical protein
VTEYPQCTVPPMATSGERPDLTCANCGGPGDDLEEVRRVYVIVDADGRVTGSETLTDTEYWCLSCRTLYPHEPNKS